VLLVPVGIVGCSADPSYEGIGSDHPLVGVEIEAPDTCDVSLVLNADACVQGRAVRVAWRDGEPVGSDASCQGERMNVAVDDDVVVGAWLDCDA
jgi:hypothetical protein